MFRKKLISKVAEIALDIRSALFWSEHRHTSCKKHCNSLQQFVRFHLILNINLKTGFPFQAAKIAEHYSVLHFMNIWLTCSYHVSYQLNLKIVNLRISYEKNKKMSKLSKYTHPCWLLTGVDIAMATDILWSCESIDLDGDNVALALNLSSKALLARTLFVGAAEKFTVFFNIKATNLFHYLGSKNYRRKLLFSIWQGIQNINFFIRFVYQISKQHKENRKYSTISKEASIYLKHLQKGFQYWNIFDKLSCFSLGSSGQCFLNIAWVKVFR